MGARLCEGGWGSYALSLSAERARLSRCERRSRGVYTHAPGLRPTRGTFAAGLVMPLR